MADVELRMRFNPDTEEVETLVDGKVLVSSGQDAFKSWVEWHNDKHKVAEPVGDKVVPPAEENVNVDAPVEEANPDNADDNKD